MAKIGNESRLILKLAKERMDEARDRWFRISHNPNSNSNNRSWMEGYGYAHQEWVGALANIIEELEK